MLWEKAVRALLFSEQGHHDSARHVAQDTDRTVQGRRYYSPWCLLSVARGKEGQMTGTHRIS